MLYLAGATGLAMAVTGCADAGELEAPQTTFEAPPIVEVPAGRFIRGSNRAEREAAYQLDETAYGHSVTRSQGWYGREFPRATIDTGGFAITRTPITNRQYRAFVDDSGYPAPDMDADTWAGYRLNHPFGSTRRFVWPVAAGRGEHPVVLVSHGDAEAYARWLSEKTGAHWRLPSEIEWEKAARGTDGRRFPWGDEFRPSLLNSHDLGPYDTMPVGQFSESAGPFGLMDSAGQVYEWTSTGDGGERYVVKGGSWDDKGCGVCRPAARHARPAPLRHIIIGFRLVRELAGQGFE